MNPVIFIRVSLIFLMAIIPLCFIGYLLAVDYENLFFLFEWSIIFFLIAATAMAFAGAFQAREKRSRWVLISILAFCLHIAVLCIFLGPLSIYPMFWVYYVVIFIAFFVYFHTIIKVKANRTVPVLLMISSSLITLFIVFQHMLWGANLT
ncbi:hypothetical protein [Fictibacillus phosphorivorans]|uniref:hypothetical protein n=1 Tax=Fictibacillus phosphorivorans TaxID=1221500 RepID=UPI00129302D8|nr:hypothetical protein [Fictibacillus phosphorivorans]MQR97597.1 hypothetical protein [Fictibacillus phosphorivorans]